MKGQPVSWIGVLMSLIQLLAKAVNKLGGGDDDIRYLVSPEGENLIEEFAQRLMEKRRGKKIPFARELEEWKRFYEKYFGFTPDFSGIQIPPRHRGYDRLIVVAKELARPSKLWGDQEKRVQPMNWAFTVCKTLFPSWRYINDLDKDVTVSDRHPNNGSYAVWVRDRIEADEENQNQSANQRCEQKCADETLLERILHELIFFDETGKHLDIMNWTLCAGSRDSGGYVPRAYWDDDEFDIGYCSPGYAGGVVRARSVVSVPAESCVSRTE